MNERTYEIFHCAKDGEMFREIKTFRDGNSYVTAGVVMAKDLEDVFLLCQNPKKNYVGPENRSLSVGDIVRDGASHWWMVANVGFKKLNLTLGIFVLIGDRP
ncbi:MAG: hypothetical protein ABIJ57_13230 [Pseudomonadota bacterium]